MNLSVNLNKVCLLRNSRGALNPCPRIAAEAVLEAGAHGLTLHWREDERHTRAADVRALREVARERGVEFNLEGDTRAELIELALDVQADQVTLVPVTPGEVTSDHGWDLPRDHETIAPLIARLKAAGIRTSIFLDAEASSVAAAHATGTDRIEIYTEPYAQAHGTPRHAAELDRLRACAQAATAIGLGVNAGHDLDLFNLPTLAREVPEVLEVSIGHALLADALYLGFAETVRRYVAATRGEATKAPRTVDA